MQFVRWENLELELKERLLTEAGLWHTDPKRSWDDLVPETRVRLADALATASDNKTGIEDDEEMLEVRRSETKNFWR
jgi:hypothetical protein